MKKIAILADYLEPSHHALIDSTAARCGFAVDYYPDGACRRSWPAPMRWYTGCPSLAT